MSPAPIPIASGSTPDSRSAIIEMAFAGNDLIHHLILHIGQQRFCRACGSMLSPTANVTSATEHGEFCPVPRFYRSIETVRKAAL